MSKKPTQATGTLVPKKAETVKLINDIKGLEKFDTKSAGWMGLVKGLNPLQHLSESIAQICHYRHQIKILETEQVRIREEAGIRHHQIHAALEASLKTIEERRLAINSSLEVVAKELEHAHIERNKIVDCITQLTTEMTNATSSTEDKKLFHTSIGVLSETLKDMGNQSTAKLSLIATNTLKALDTLPQTRSLLTFSE